MSHPWQFARGFCRVLNRSQKGRSSESRHGGQGWASRLRGWACEQALGSTLLAGHHWRIRATCGGPLWVPAPSQGPRMLAAPANSASRHSGWGSPRSPETPSCSASTGPDTDHAHPGLGRWLCGPSRAQDVRDQGPAQRANLPESCCSRHGSVHSSLGGGLGMGVLTRPAPVWDRKAPGRGDGPEELPGQSEESLLGHLSGPQCPHHGVSRGVRWPPGSGRRPSQSLAPALAGQCL